MKKFDEPDKLYATFLKKYNVSSFKELTVKQRVEILEGLNELSRKKEAQDGDKIHSSGATERATWRCIHVAHEESASNESFACA